MRIAILALVALSTSACATNVATKAPAPSDVATTRATAPRGRTFDVRLETPLDSQRAQPGDRIRATLEEPLLASDGAVIAPRGTRVLGRVLSVERAGLNRLTVQIDELVLAERTYAIDARVRWVESARVTHPEPATPGSIVANVYPEGVPATALGIGGGPPVRDVPVELPRGARLQLVLERPFALVGAIVTTPSE